MMRVRVDILAALALATASLALANAEPYGRGGRGAEGGRAPPVRSEPRGGYRAPGYAPPPVYAGRPGYAPAPPSGPYAPRSYAPGTYAQDPYGYARPPAYAAPPAYAPVPGYRPNSLGADWAQQQDQARRGVRQGGLMPLAQVMAGIRRGTPGRLLDAGLEPGPDGRPAYRVRWAAAGGRRIDFIVDAATGAILRRNGY
jgi:hypothetical protein